jgi:hypothetical protein
MVLRTPARAGEGLIHRPCPCPRFIQRMGKPRLTSTGQLLFQSASAQSPVNVRRCDERVVKKGNKVETMVRSCRRVKTRTKTCACFRTLVSSLTIRVCFCGRWVKTPLAAKYKQEKEQEMMTLARPTAILRAGTLSKCRK